MITTARHNKVRSRRSTPFTMHERTLQKLTVKGDAHFPSRLQVHATCTTTSRHKWRPNGFSQCSYACIANVVVPKAQSGDGPIHLVILHKNSAAITTPKQYQVLPDLLPNGLGTPFRGNRGRSCEGLSCLVLPCQFVSRRVAARLAAVTAGGPRYPECCLETECQFQMSNATLKLSPSECNV